MPVRRWVNIAILALAIAVSAVADRYASRAVGGADSYGYISQADGWLAGDVLPHQRFLEAQHDRPVTQWTFAPLGWKPSKTSSDLVPTYAPGYPMLLALAKGAFGHSAMFRVVPLMAGLLVWSTFFLGCRLGRREAGAVAALIVASSATVLFMSMAPMSDVPSAAMWTLTLACVLGRTRVSAAIAGVICAAAILIRPNLLPLAALMALWALANDFQQHRVKLWRGRAWLFTIGAAAGAAWNAILNYRWYGNAAESGYGDLGALFSLNNFGSNLYLYASWLAGAETPLAIAGLAVVLLFSRHLSRRRDAVGVPALITAFVAWVWGLYLFYLVFDAWWYLRFVLPAFPLMAIGSASLAELLWRRRPSWRIAVAGVVLLSCVATVSFAWRHDAFRIGLTESRYPQVARGVASLTEPQAAIITMQHSGSVRYYGGRMTLRWDVIAGTEFSALVEWLRRNQHHPYLLVDAAEMPALRARFQNDPALVPATWLPSAAFFDSQTMLFDLDAKGPTMPAALGTYTRRAIQPVPPAEWVR